jgi:hypothetical protein
MIAGTATRLAGKALGDFLKVGLPVIGSTVEQAVLNKLVEKYAPREVPIQGPLPRQYSKNVYIPGHPLYGASSGMPLGTATEIPEAASSKIGQIVTKLGPEKISKVAGAFAPFAAVGAALAGTGLINKVLQGQENVYAQSQYSLPLRQPPTPVAFANQQYTPGMSPMTNQTVAEAMLEQQKFQHQLQLINARQSAQQSVGIGGRTTGGGLDIMGLSQQVFTPVSY